MPEFRDSRQVAKYIKDQCKNFDPNKIYILNKVCYSTFGFIVIKDNNLLHQSFYGSEGLSKIIPKLKEYFDGKSYDTAYYCEFYGNDEHPEGVFKFDNEEEAIKALDEIRAKHGADVGMRDAAKPLNSSAIVWKG